tara:strand:+ start:10270 stop:10662 length:393 start_codon:yes stop_codon:yes gene_type:complete
MTTINKAFTKMVDGKLPGSISLFAMNFGKAITQTEAVETIQDSLFRDIGASGNFRVAPVNKELMTLSFIEGCETAEFQPIVKNTIVIAFATRDEVGEGFDYEYKALSTELSKFAENNNVHVQQLDVNNYY